jgi:hypothetical protein
MGQDKGKAWEIRTRRNTGMKVPHEARVSFERGQDFRATGSLRILGDRKVD